MTRARDVQDTMRPARQLSRLLNTGSRDAALSHHATMRIARSVYGFTRLLRWSWALAPVVAGAQAPKDFSGGVLISGSLSFSAHATVGDFTGTTTTVTGAFTGGPSAAQGWVEAPVATLATHNDHRDRDLRASMEVDQYPLMRFDLVRATMVTASERPSDTASVILHGTLALHGVTRAVQLPASALRVGDTVYVRSSFPLDLGDYRIGGLTKMLGLLRMDPKITVHVDLRFQTKPPLESVTSPQ